MDSLPSYFSNFRPEDSLNSFEKERIFENQHENYELKHDFQNFYQTKKDYDDSDEEISSLKSPQQGKNIETGQNLSQNEWCAEEEQFMLEQYLEMGPKWTKISKILHKEKIYNRFRSENDVKNKFYGTLRKTLRRINQIPKLSKEIKYESAMRILECKEKTNGLPEVLMAQAMGIREKIISLMEVPEEKELNLEVVLSIHQEANKFNLSSRCYRFKKICTRHSKASYEKPSKIEQKSNKKAKRPTFKDTNKEVIAEESEAGEQFYIPLGRTQQNIISQRTKTSQGDFSNLNDPFQLPIFNQGSPLLWEIQNLEQQYKDIIGEVYEPEIEFI